MNLINKECLIVILILVIIIMYYYKYNEYLMSPGYFNRSDVDVDIDKTYGGTDKNFHKDVRFGV